MGRHRAWCFTINNYTASDEFACDMLMKKAKYGIIGFEEGTLLQTPHIQGYIHLVNPLSLLCMKKYLSRAHLEVANGSDEENYVYCSKQGKFTEWGEKSAQGKRNDISEVAALIKSGDISLTDVMFDYPIVYVKYSRSLEKMFQAIQPHREQPPQVFWRYGLAGVGKTRYVIDTYGEENIYIKDNTQWWDGYNQQQVVLIDDFDNKIPYRTLLRILDRYRYSGQVKGGYVNLNSPYIYITCEHPPSVYWAGNELAQIERRLTSVSEIF